MRSSPAGVFTSEKPSSLLSQPSCGRLRAQPGERLVQPALVLGIETRRDVDPDAQPLGPADGRGQASDQAVPHSCSLELAEDAPRRAGESSFRAAIQRPCEALRGRHAQILLEALAKLVRPGDELLVEIEPTGPHHPLNQREAGIDNATLPAGDLRERAGR